MEAKMIVSIKIESKERAQWHKILTGTRAAEEADHGRSSTYKALDNADRIVCDALTASWACEITLSPRAAAAVREYAIDTIAWCEEHATGTTDSQWPLMLYGVESMLDWLEEVPGHMLTKD